MKNGGKLKFWKMTIKGLAHVTYKPFRKPWWTGNQNNRKNGPRSKYFEENREPLFQDR